ncbi:MAG TPA: pyridoxamine 5'-phosphate oxidase family protein [Acidimicrobiales bacterium]|nr:pyridoxamine 5'-phosphate oxidase family protein [Acidimicrobiales bacterium]
MLDPETVALLESGCSLTVATVGPDGAPHASRGFGVTVLPDGAHLRLLLDADDVTAVANLAAGGAVAVTGCVVATLRSVQVKGRAEPPVPATDAADLARAANHCDAFFAEVSRLEGTPVPLLARLQPTDYAVCTVAVEDVFDQTPGPVAGSPLGSAR